MCVQNESAFCLHYIYIIYNIVATQVDKNAR